ncbi:hypothetical protein [Nonomuraea sp. WAC 01424]|uniref:hypothetical protein n=1 Tax=Nonomuraea sp. WAC 01424 TaxID=2203200 RepID=UPI000F76C654|nr:hypothetical protein [Nonomuraea sp. WAC 01424]
MSETPGTPGTQDRLVATDPRPHRPARPGGTPVTVRRRVVASVAYVVRVASRTAALALALYALFTVFRANPANAWYQLVESLASWLSLGLANLFQLADPRWTTLVNLGLAAVVWLVAGSALASLIKRAAP